MRDTSFTVDYAHACVCYSKHGLTSILWMGVKIFIFPQDTADLSLNDSISAFLGCDFRIFSPIPFQSGLHRTNCKFFVFSDYSHSFSGADMQTTFTTI